MPTFAVQLVRSEGASLAAFDRAVVQRSPRLRSALNALAHARCVFPCSLPPPRRQAAAAPPNMKMRCRPASPVERARLRHDCDGAAGNYCWDPSGQRSIGTLAAKATHHSDFRLFGEQGNNNVIVPLFPSKRINRHCGAELTARWK